MALNLSKHHKVLWRFIEAFTTYSPAIVHLRLHTLLGTTQAATDVIEFLLNLLLDLVDFASISIDILLLLADINELEGGSLEVLL